MKIELLGTNTKKHFEEQVKICAAACKLSRLAGTVDESMFENYDEALRFVRRVIDMGHTSTIDHDYMVFSLSKISPVIEQTIIAERFSSFTIKSRREVDYSNPEFVTPNFHNENGVIHHNNDELRQKYDEHMRKLFAAYNYLIKQGLKKEDARFVLPYSYHAEIIMGLDATSLTRMIIDLTKGKRSNITELREFGEELYNIAKERAPYITTIIDKKESRTSDSIEDILNNITKPRNYKLIEKPILLEHTPNIDDTIFINALARIYSLSYEEATKIYQISLPEELKSELIKAVLHNNHHEDLKQLNFKFNFAISFAVLTHITRHRTLDLSIPEFVPNVDLTKYITPPSIKQKDLETYYQSIHAENLAMYNYFKAQGIKEEDLIYFTLSGNAVNIILKADGEALRSMSRVRECFKTQWETRYILNAMHSEINKVSKYYSQIIGPDCETKGICPEGKESCGRVLSLNKNN